MLQFLLTLHAQVPPEDKEPNQLFIFYSCSILPDVPSPRP